MGALRDPKLEKFAQALAENLIAGVKRCKAAEEAAKAADYKGSSLAANARSRAQRADVKARVAELLRPGIAKGEAKIEATKEWAKSKLSAIASPDLGKKKTKVTDQIAAIKLLAEIEGWKSPDEVKATVKVTVQGGLPEGTPAAMG